VVVTSVTSVIAPKENSSVKNMSGRGGIYNPLSFKSHPIPDCPTEHSNPITFDASLDNSTVPLPLQRRLRRSIKINQNPDLKRSFSKYLWGWGSVCQFLYPRVPKLRNRCKVVLEKKDVNSPTV